jgi:hypothetical protein
MSQENGVRTISDLSQDEADFATSAPRGTAETPMAGAAASGSGSPSVPRAPRP